MPRLGTETLAAAAVLIVAAALRWTAVDVWPADLLADPDGYRGLASRLGAGAGFVGPSGDPTAFRPPLYPLLLAGVIPFGAAGIAALQIALGTATVGLTERLGRRLGLGAWSLLAAGLVALDPLLLRYTPRVMTEVTCAFLAALLLWSLAPDNRAATVRARSTGPDRGPRPPLPDGRGSVAERDEPRNVSSLMLGVLFGLCVLSRPTFWAFGLLAAAAWFWDRLRGRDAARNRIVAAAVLLLGVAVVVSPWAVRNAVAVGRPVVTTTHGGYTLLLANNPVFYREVVHGPLGAVWDGGSLNAWQRSLETAMAAEGVRPDEPARDRWAKDRAWRTIRSRPLDFLRACRYRLARFWDVGPLGAAAGTSPAVLWGVRLFYAATFMLAAIGAVGLIRNGNPRWRSAPLLIAGFCAVHAVYWTDARMRAPLVPAIAILAARGAAVVGKAVSGRPAAVES